MIGVQIWANDNPERAVVLGFRDAQRIVESELRTGIGRLRPLVRAETARALGPKVANTWRRPIFVVGNPRNLQYRAYFSSKVPHIIRTFEEGATIRARRKKYMTIPLPGTTRGAGAFRRQRLTPETYQKTYNTKLAWVPISNGRYLLVDRDSSIRNVKGRPRIVRRRSAKKFPEGVPVFLALPRSQAVRLQKKLQLRRLEEQAGRATAQRIQRRLNGGELGRRTAQRSLRRVA